MNKCHDKGTTIGTCINKHLIQGSFISTLTWSAHVEDAPLNLFDMKGPRDQDLLLTLTVPVTTIDALRHFETG